jgi:hypothetical protein
MIAKTPIYAMPELDRRKPSLLNLLGLRQLAPIYTCYSAIYHFSQQGDNHLRVH